MGCPAGLVSFGRLLLPVPALIGLLTASVVPAYANPGIELVYASAEPSDVASSSTARAALKSDAAVNVDSPAGDEQTEDGATEDEAEAQPGHSTLHKVLCYLPNRVFDIFDLFRARVRVGPGLGGGFRVTKVAQLYLGSSVTLYGGLPGPRQHPKVPLPVGVELNNKAAISVLDASADAGLGPDYSPTEVGAGFQLVILGVDIGFDPVEIVDLFGGIAGFDPRNDDF